MGQTDLRPTAEEREYSRVLQFMHWAMNQPEGKGKAFGELLKLGCETLGLPLPPPEIEAGLLKAAFKLAGVPFSTVMA